MRKGAFARLVAIQLLRSNGPRARLHPHNRLHTPELLCNILPLNVAPHQSLQLHQSLQRPMSPPCLPPQTKVNKEELPIQKRASVNQTQQLHRKKRLCNTFLQPKKSPKLQILPSSTRPFFSNQFERDSRQIRQKNFRAMRQDKGSGLITPLQKGK